MTLSFGTFLTGPMQAWSKMNFALWRRTPSVPSARHADVPDYLRRDLGLPPPGRPTGAGYPAPDKVTFF